MSKGSYAGRANGTWFCDTCLNAQLGIMAGLGGIIAGGVQPFFALQVNGRPSSGGSVSIAGIAAISPPLAPVNWVISGSVDYNVNSGMITVKLPGMEFGAAAFIGVQVSGNCTSCTSTMQFIQANGTTWFNNQIAVIKKCMQNAMNNLYKAITQLNGQNVPPGGKIVTIKVPPVQ